MFEFVNLTGPGAGRDDQTRRQVRSQAMRDFRRRQRAENERKRGVASSTTAITSAGPHSRAASDSSLPRRKQDVVKPPLQLRHTADPTLPVTTLSAIRADDTSSDELANPLIWNNAELPTTPELYGPELIDPGLAALDQASSRSKAPDTHSARVGSQHLFSLCASFLAHFCPAADTNAAANPLTSRQDAVIDTPILEALCLASVGHMDVGGQSVGRYDATELRAEVYKDISRCLTTGTCLPNESIGCLICLISQEMSVNSKDSILHLHALKGLVEMKGGLSAFSESLAMIIECLDLSYGFIFNTAPVYTLPDDGSLPAGSVALNRPYEAAHALMNLLKLEAMEYGRTTDADPYRQRLSFVSELVDNVKEMLHYKELLGPDSLIDPNLANRWQQALENVRLSGLEADLSTPDAHYLARITYLQWLLIYNLVVHPLPSTYAGNQAVITGMWDTAWKISEPAWFGLPYLRLWILLSGASNATDQTERGFFQASVIRCVFRLGSSRWTRVKTFVIRFFWSRVLYKGFADGRIPKPATASVISNNQPDDATSPLHATQNTLMELSTIVQLVQNDSISYKRLSNPPLQTHASASQTLSKSMVAESTGAEHSTKLDDLTLEDLSSSRHSFDHTELGQAYTASTYWDFRDNA